MTAASALAYLDFQANERHIHREPIQANQPDGVPLPDRGRPVANGPIVDLGGANEDEADVRRTLRAIETLTGIDAEYPPA